MQIPRRCGTSTALNAEHPAIRRPQKATRHWPWLAALASGVLLALSFPPADQGWLAWVALVPLICAVWFGQDDSASPAPRSKRPLALGYLAGVVFSTVSFSWLGELAPLFANAGLRSLPLVLGLYIGLYFAFWSWFLVLARPRTFVHSIGNLAVAALGASAWVAHEWLRSWLFTGFGWNTLGVALHHDLAMIQIVDHTGVAGLSWLIAFCNLMAVLIVRRLIEEFGPTFLKRMRWEFSATVALVVFVWAYGTRTLLRVDASPTVLLRVAAIQANIPQRAKFDPDQESFIFAQFRRLTDLALVLQPPPQLVLWPESATPRGLFDDELNHDFVFDLAGRIDGALLLGTTNFDLEHNEDFNIAALLTERGERLQIHRKIHLVPFGEYLPLRSILEPAFGRLISADFSFGREFTVFELHEPAIKASALICFEDTLADLSRRFVVEGAQVLVNITNDGWFAQSAASRQHLANSIFRAVENRRPLIRCANTGVSGLVSTTGYFDQWVPEFQEGIGVREIAIPSSAAQTFFTRHGDLLSPISAAITALAIGFVWLGKRRAVGISPVRT